MASTPDAASITLDQRLCLALYTASRAMTARYRPLLAELGLTYPQYLVMALLWEEGPASVGQIGERLRLDSSTLSPLVKRLEATGLVARERSRDDERSVIVRPTAAGAQLQSRAGHVPQEICDAAGLPIAEQLTLVGTLRELAAELERSTRIARD